MSKASDELREWAEVLKRSVYTKVTAEKIVGFADRIDAEMVELPKDAHGEYIRVGDTLDGYGKTIEVVEMRYGRGGWVLISRDGSGYADTFAFAHHHVPTVEDVLADVADRAANLTGSYHEGGMNGDEYMDSMSALVTEYAAKLRMAGDE